MKCDVAIVMGSETDLATMRAAAEVLTQFKVSHQLKILSAHRTPDAVARFAKTARKNKFKIIIAGAGGAAHLPGLIAAHTELPVIGVPVLLGSLKGHDALYSIVQMPKGIPVATVAIGNATNAGLLAVQMLGLGQKKLLDQIQAYKKTMNQLVLKKASRL